MQINTYYVSNTSSSPPISLQIEKIMSLSLSCGVPKPYSSSSSSCSNTSPNDYTRMILHPPSIMRFQSQRRSCPVAVRCELSQSDSSSSSARGGEAAGRSLSSKKLEIGSPVIVIEAPTMIKTAASVPCLRVNDGLVKLGDVGRIVSRKPKDVWAVRLSIGTYLIDGKYFKPLDLDE